jgi:hypothetical protein
MHKALLQMIELLRVSGGLTNGSVNSNSLETRGSPPRPMGISSNPHTADARGTTYEQLREGVENMDPVQKMLGHKCLPKGSVSFTS